MPNDVTAGMGKDSGSRRRTRLLKLRSAGGSGVGGGDREPRSASRRRVVGRTASSETAGTYWRQPACH